MFIDGAELIPTGSETAMTKFRRDADRLRLPALQPAADADRAGRTSCCRCGWPAARIDEAVRRGGAGPQLGLGDRLDHRPAQLSGGQQQRVAIARALVTRPRVIFADEPTGALDTRSARDVLALLPARCATTARTVVMVTHDPVAAAYADSVVFLADGRIVGRAGPADRRRGRRAAGPPRRAAPAPRVAGVSERWSPSLCARCGTGPAASSRRSSPRSSARRS